MKIPVYRRQSTPSPGRIAPQETGEAGVRIGQQISKAGAKLAEIGAKFEELRAHQQTSQAKVDAYKTLTELNAEAANNPDIDNPEVQQGYFDKIAQAKGTIAAGISNPRARDTFVMQYDLDAIKQRAQIANYGRKRIISKAKATTQEQLDLMRETYTASNNLEDRRQILDQGIQKINYLKTRGLITPEEAYKMEKATKKDWADSAINVLIANDPEEAKRQLLANQFPEMSQEEKADAIDTAEKAVGTQQREELGNLYDEWIQIYAAEPWNWEKRDALVDKIAEAVSDRTVEPRSASQLIRMVRGERKAKPKTRLAFIGNKRKWTENLVKKFEDLKERATRDPGSITETEVRVLWSLIGDGMADGYLSNEAASNWLYSTALTSNEETLADFLEGNISPRKLDLQVRVMESLKSFGDWSYEIISDSVKKARDSDNLSFNSYLSFIEQSTKEMVLKLFPEIKNAPKTGMTYIDAKGNKIKIYPSGEIEEQ